MEKRTAKVNISAAGGTAGKGANTCKLTLPSSWLASMGISEKDRNVELTFDGERITVSKPITLKDFIAAKSGLGHKLVTFLYYDSSELCTRILADFTDQSLFAENYTERYVKTAFGRNAFPSWTDFLGFLEERCVPRQRAGLREYLESLGLDDYEPMDIVRKTQGRMAEDHQWIEVVEA